MEFKDGSKEFVAFQMAVYLDGEGDKKQGRASFLISYEECLKVVKGQESPD